MRSATFVFLLASTLTACSSATSDTPPAEPATPPAADPPPAPQPAPAPPPAQAPLPAGVTALTIPPAASELAPLDEIAARVQAIGIGESVHTSGGFVDAKASLVQHLVETQGYRAIAFESPRAGVAKKMAAYVATCTGDPVNAMGGLFRVWWSPATRDLMSWLCKFNSAHAADPVKVVGFDMQEPVDDSAAINAFLTSAAPADAAALGTGLTTCSSTYDVSPATTDSDYASCIAGLDKLDAYYTDHAAALAAAGADAFTDAKLDALSFRAWQTERYQYTRNAKASYEARDIGMAAVFADARARALAGKKTILWAHNYHLAKQHSAVTEGYPPNAKNLGEIVATEMGATYAAIGLVGWDVQIAWPGVGDGHLADPSADAYEVLLHALRHPSLFVRLDRTTGPLSGALSRPVGTPSEETIVPSQQFDAFFYVDVSPPMTHVGW
jgi:erythromycin esterase-like protein